MTKGIQYTNNDNTDEKIRNGHFIPYMVNRSTQYIPGEIYYSSYWMELFKVLSCEYDHNKLISAYVRYFTGYYGITATPLAVGDYHLIKDINNIYRKNIIEDGEIYTGAEIIYWFFMQRITCFDKKYKDYWKYVDRYSGHRLSDTSYYKIIGFRGKDGNYYNCRIIKVKTPK